METDNHSNPNDLAVNRSLNGDAQDSRSLITAYALGELTAIERDEIEARLRDSMEDRQMAEELSRLGKLLRKAAVGSPLLDRSPTLRQAMLAELQHPRLGPPLRLPERFPRRAIWLRLSLAASLLVVASTLVALTKTKHAERQVAQHDPIIARNGTTAEGAYELADSNGITPDPASGAPLNYFAVGAPYPEAETPGITAPRVDGGMVGPVGTMTPGGVGGGGQRGGRQDQLYSRLAGANLSTSGQRGQARGAGERDPQAELAAAKAEYAYRKKQYERIENLVDERAVDANLAEEARLGRDAAKARLIAANAAAGSGDNMWFFRFGELSERAADGGGQFPNTESYAPLIESPFRKPTEYPLSTFSIDVDTASYTNVRRFLSSRSMPPPDAVRIEELVNYFSYGYPQPEGDVPFSVTTDVADCPWNAQHRLLRVGLKGREVPDNARPASNLVFLLDVSGSMQAPNKLPLVKEAMYLLTDKLGENDRVAIVVYAGNSGLALPPTNGANRAAIRNAIGQLVASGSTNGGKGIQMAYDTAQSQFIKGGTNRVILATDGDFNVGIIDQSGLVTLIEDKAKSGVFLSALGFGVGNLKDGTLEKLADKGNGNYAYIDTLGEARRVLVEQLSGTLVTIAKDVKLQIEFNPAQAAEYRLIGYENRILPTQDFQDDRKDAGEIGAGHTVTALYEIVPAERATANREEPLKYQRAKPIAPAGSSDELATLKLRYKSPEANESRLIEHIVTDRRPQPAAAGDLAFAAAVAQFGMLLRHSPYRGEASYQSVLALAEQGLANDANGHRSEFIELVRQAREISGK